MKVSEQEICMFSEKISEIVEELDCKVMDAVLYYCELNGLEEDVAALHLSPNLIQTIRLEAEELNMIKKTERLF